VIRRAICAAAVLAALAGTAQAQNEPCPATPPPPAISVPHVAAAMKANEEVVIVAIGSSSTQSWMSSNPAHSYPAVLQADLEKAFPTAHFAVINRGIGGQDAAEEVTRLDGDVMVVRPQLVIWQVGANGVLRQTGTDVFKKLVSAGIARLQAAKLDVVLMDNQRSPMIVAAPDHLKIDQALVDLAHDANISLFQRSRLMDGWRDAGVPYATFVSPDGLHLNDLGYRCTADALAAALIEGLRRPATNMQVSAMDKARDAAAGTQIK